MAERRQPAYRNLLGFQVTSTADALRRGAALQMRREHEMSLAQFRTLSLIEHLQPVRLRDVAADASADKAQISRVVTSLVARGYVTRRALAGDARSAYLELTPEGRAKLEAVSRALEERDREIHATLQPAEAEQLAALLTRVRKGADHFAADEERLEKQQRKSAPSPAPD